MSDHDNARGVDLNNQNRKGVKSMKRIRTIRGEEVVGIFDDLRKRLESCTEEDIPELLKLSEELHDLLIEHVAFLRKHGMKTRLTKAWTNLISED